MACCSAVDRRAGLVKMTSRSGPNSTIGTGLNLGKDARWRAISSALVRSLTRELNTRPETANVERKMPSKSSESPGTVVANGPWPVAVLPMATEATMRVTVAVAR